MIYAYIETRLQMCGFMKLHVFLYVQMENVTDHEVQFSTKSIFPKLIIHFGTYILPQKLLV